MNLCYDELTKDGIGRPNLARFRAEPFTTAWREFDRHWPFVVPLRLLHYVEPSRFRVYTTDTAPSGSWYPVALSWFDHDIDYFALMGPKALRRARQGEIRVLFYYHEGDNPGRMIARLEHCRLINALPENSYLLISANTAASNFPQSRYFCDHEYFFRYLNRRQTPIHDTTGPKQRFTAINRTHKWWRASIMAELEHSGILDQALWSYDPAISCGDHPDDNPLELDSVPGWRSRVESFVQHTHKILDPQTAHNDHHWVNQDLYHHSMCGLVFETHFDADQSQGAFLTEKTFKCIKYGQPFVIIGCAGSLEALRSQGYRVFDHAIDNKYDLEPHNTARWLLIQKVIQDLCNQNISRWRSICVQDVQHNQQLFLEGNPGPLNSLLETLETIS